MKIKIFVSVLLLSISIIFSYTSSEAASDVSFPADWRKWNSVSTTLTEIGALPDCNADVSKLPPIYQETVATYCGVRQGGPGKVAVLVNPGAMDAYKSRNGKFKDGGSMILHLKDMKVLFVTAHKGGSATYGVFTEDGKDITANDGPLSATTCKNCHTGYTAFCVNGQCGKIK